MYIELRFAQQRKDIFSQLKTFINQLNGLEPADRLILMLPSGGKFNKSDGETILQTLKGRHKVLSLLLVFCQSAVSAVQPMQEFSHTL